MHPKRTAGLVLFLMSALFLRAETSIWKISRGGNYLLLGGSPSIIRHDDYPLPPEFDQAIDRAAIIYFPTDMARVAGQGTQQMIANRGVYHDGTTIDQVLTPEAWQAVQEFARKHALPTARMLHFKTWRIVGELYGAELESLGAAGRDVDGYVFHRASDAGKPMKGLEPLEQILDFMDTAGAGHESEWVLAVLEEFKDLPDEAKRIVAEWRTGNAENLESLLVSEMYGSFPSGPTDTRSRVIEHNQHWLPIIDRLVTTPEVEFVLVSTANLAGPDGLLEGLRKKGCQVVKWRPD
jgi:uncharacterized protein YbaP (TraB family)